MPGRLPGARAWRGERIGAATMRPTLGLTGLTVNAMTMIAPGAFLWITFQLQAAQTVPGGASTAADMWPGLALALGLAFLTALSYAELARVYPEAGAGSCYYFAERAFADQADARHRQLARPARIVAGWAAHLFYWLYPGVMAAAMATLATHLLAQLDVSLPVLARIGVAVAGSLLVGSIALRGVAGATTIAAAVTVIQLVALVGFSLLATAYRLSAPPSAAFVFPTAAAIVLPKDVTAVLLQATIASLMLVGFESATAFGAEARNPRRDVPRAVILALAVQGLLVYLLQYFAANIALSGALRLERDGQLLTGMDAAAASPAPIGDLTEQIATAMFGGVGVGLTVATALTVGLALLGTALAATSAGARITYAMARDGELPEPLGRLHVRYATPHAAIAAIVVVSAIVGAIGATSVVALTGVALASSLGTFVLYALTCLSSLVASRPGCSFVRHRLVPALGLVANALLLVAIFGMALASGGDVQTEATIALAIGAAWAATSAAYALARPAAPEVAGAAWREPRARLRSA
jgi:APA family basic amino acid/polyamine antiporter